MNVSVLIFASLIFSSVVNASQDVGPLSQLADAKTQTYFEIIGELHKNGVSVKIEDLNNTAWAGRCFNAKTPSTPRAAGLVLREREPGDTNAPSYQTGATFEKHHVLATFTSVTPMTVSTGPNSSETTFREDSTSPDRYDRLNYGDALQLIEQNRPATGFNPFRVFEGTIIDFLGFGYRSISTFRLNDGFLVEEIQTHTPADKLGIFAWSDEKLKNEFFARSQASFRCYYFNKSSKQ